MIAGNIPAGKQQYFEEKVKPFLNERISYIGLVNDEQKNELLGNALALLMPIQWNEPFGIVMAEAMACGTPVLGFPFGAVPEVVENGVNGFVCKDLPAMVENVEKIRSIGRKQVRITAENKFSSSKVTAEYLHFYSQLISNKSASETVT